MKKATYIFILVIALLAGFACGQLYTVKNAVIGVSTKTYKTELTTPTLSGYHRYKYNGGYIEKEY